MPTLRKDKAYQWMARVVIRGKQVAVKFFPPGKRYGPEWRQAKEWEEEQHQIALQKLEEERKKEEEERLKATKTQTDLERFLYWGNTYLSHSERTMRKQTYREKRRILQEFYLFCHKERIFSLDAVSTPKAYMFLSKINDSRGGHVANKFRKHLLAAWRWAMDFMDDFPQERPPFQRVRPFAVEEQDRYVPPEEDVISVLQQAEGQDLVMLLTMYYTGARRSEVFNLQWKDISFDDTMIRLKDCKGGNGQGRTRWLSLHPELVKALLWWKEARPCEVDNVFMQVHCTSTFGEPYRQRRHFMRDLCQKAEVKHFGFHAIRHKSAAITFMASGLNAAQILMGHYRASTTDRYTKSAGLYSDHDDILEALGNSEIGQMVGNLLKEKIPQSESSKGLCNQECNPNCVTKND